MPDYLPSKELDLQTWMTNFVTVADSNKTQLGLTPAEVTQLTDALAEFNNALGIFFTQKAQMEGAARDKDNARQGMTADVRPVVRAIQTRPGISDGLKATLGITVPNPVKNRTAPVTPVEVQAKPEAIGVNTLKWSKAGNKQTTQYLILAKTLTNGARVGYEAGWNIVGQTTRARFAHTGVTPGVPMAYKVMAARADQASLPSLPATVYGG